MCGCKNVKVNIYPSYVLHIAHISIYNDVAHLFSGLCTNNRNSRERVGPREDSIEIQGPENIPGGSFSTDLRTGGKEDNLDIIQIYQILQINRLSYRE